MENLQGKLIEATSLLDDSVFEKAVVLITEHNSNGASGFVINKPFPRKLNELEEFSHEAAIDLYAGGPVATEYLFFMHSVPDLITGGKAITDHLFLAGDFKKAVELLTNGKLSPTQVKIFIGYCGWDAGELENEIEEGSWNVKSGSLFKSEPL